MIILLWLGIWLLASIAMAEEDTPKTRFGMFEFNVMPFGITKAPATFRRLMTKVLKGLQWKILVL